MKSPSPKKLNRSKPSAFVIRHSALLLGLLLLCRPAAAQIEFTWTEPDNINPATHFIGNDASLIAIQYNIYTAPGSNSVFTFVAGSAPVGQTNLVITSLPNPTWACLRTVAATNGMFIYSTNTPPIYIDTNAWLIEGQNFVKPASAFSAHRPKG